MTAELAPQIGKPVDTQALAQALERIVAEGRFSSATYGLTERAGQAGLAVTLVPRAGSPPFARFALELSNERSDIELGVGTRVTFLDPTTAGSEIRLDAALGTRSVLAAELLQPLAGPRFFVAPRVFALRAQENLYEDGDLLAVYRRERAGLEADLGLFLGTQGEWRAGYTFAWVREHVRVGAPELPESSGQESILRLRWKHEGQDRPFFPRRGFRAELDAMWYLEAPAVERDVGLLGGRAEIAVPVATRDRLLLSASGGGTVGGDTPVAYMYRLGGTLRLGAFDPESFRGRHYVLGQAAYLLDLGRMPELLGERFFATLLAESGSAFDSASAAAFHGSLTLGLAAQTALGPAFVGAGVGDEDARRFYFTLGRFVR